MRKRGRHVVTAVTAFVSIGMLIYIKRLKEHGLGY